jgi:hypothetical protein
MYCLVLVDERGQEQPAVLEQSPDLLEALGRQIQEKYPHARWRVIAWDASRARDRTPDRNPSPRRPPSPAGRSS